MKIHRKFIININEQKFQELKSSLEASGIDTEASNLTDECLKIFLLAQYKTQYPEEVVIKIEISEKKQIITNQKDQVKDFQKEPILIEELNELNYEEAIVEDKRSFPKFYHSLVLDKQIILSTIVNKSPIYPLSLRLIMLLFTLMTFFFF